MARLETLQGSVEVVVKQFRNQGARARLRRRLKGSKAARSWRVAHALLEAGILTPDPVMLIDSTDESGPSFYICAHLPGLLEARYLLRAANAGTEREQFPHVDLPAFLAELGRLARRLHDAQIWHRDLTSGNVLIRFHEDGTPSALYLLDLNRARLSRPLTLSERMRDLSRMPILRADHQRLFLASYWEGEGLRPSVPRSDWQRSAHEGAEGDRAAAGRRGAQALYLAYHRAFLLRNSAKQRIRSGTRKLKDLLLPRTAHAHIPSAPSDASARDKIVWDHLSDQPHQHAGRLDKLRVRLADARSHAAEAAAVAAALPRIWSRYRALQRALHTHPVPFQGSGICVRPWPEDPEALLHLIDDLGARAVLLRLHPWEDGHAAELALARELHARGCELTYALPQNRELVRDPHRWRRSIETIAGLFLPYGRRFQIGQAINRSKWGIWNLEEYATLARAAADVLRQHPGVELLGPSVIDFEYHVAAAVLNLNRPGLRFDAVSSLLYVDRRGAPENEQAGFDTVGKVLLLRAIAETSKNATGRCWITEVNWPLREGPHSPAGRSVSVGEEEAADYLVRYYLLALGTGAVERVFWWQMIAKGYGLVDPVSIPSGSGDLRRRPAFYAFRTLVRELEGAVLQPVPAVTPPARLYTFRKSDGTEVAVGWSVSGTASLTLPRPARAVVGRDGQDFPVPTGAEVEVTPSPRYFHLV